MGQPIHLLPSQEPHREHRLGGLCRPARGLDRLAGLAQGHTRVVQEGAAGSRQLDTAVDPG